MVEWITDGSPGTVVAKISQKPDYCVLKNEFKALDHYRRHTGFPVPAPYAVISEPGLLSGTVSTLVVVYIG